MVRQVKDKEEGKEERRWRRGRWKSNKTAEKSWSEERGTICEYKINLITVLNSRPDDYRCWFFSEHTSPVKFYVESSFILVIAFVLFLFLVFFNVVGYHYNTLEYYALCMMYGFHFNVINIVHVNSTQYDTLEFRIGKKV